MLPLHGRPLCFLQKHSRTHVYYIRKSCITINALLLVVLPRPEAVKSVRRAHRRQSGHPGVAARRAGPADTGQGVRCKWAQEPRGTHARILVAAGLGMLESEPAAGGLVCGISKSVRGSESAVAVKQLFVPSGFAAGPVAAAGKRPRYDGDNPRYMGWRAAGKRRVRRIASSGGSSST